VTSRAYTGRPGASGQSALVRCAIADFLFAAWLA
jgi:hypothetical protein